jgi:hypothetical protein
VVDDDDVVEGIVLLRKGADADAPWTPFTPRSKN